MARTPLSSRKTVSDAIFDAIFPSRNWYEIDVTGNDNSHG